MIGKPGLSIKEAAKVAGKHESVIKYAIAHGRLPATEVGLGGRIHVDRRALLAIVEARAG